MDHVTNREVLIPLDERDSRSAGDDNQTRTRLTASAGMLQPGRREFTHGHYRVIAGERKGLNVAIAYLGERRIDQVVADRLEDAVASLIESLDERRRRYAEARIEGIPSAEEYREALERGASALNGARGFLFWHLRAPDQRTTFGDLSRLAGSHPEDVTGAYLRLGRRLSTILKFRPAGLDARLKPILTLAEATEAADPHLIMWTLRPELVAALNNIQPVPS
ncbi:hypothetical protein ACFOYU_11690 [Microvirga sp. GCM10011540]|uniref:hypothetical protein n=1 Tax=Microvirga sp. GCM10011540 TaxID=3317338 RepID=UPI003614353E